MCRHSPVGSNHHKSWKGADTIRCGDSCFVTHDDGIRNGLCLEKLLHRFALLAYIDPENHEALRAVIRVKFLQRWHALDAGTAPGCPEVEQDRFPFQFFKTVSLAVETHTAESRCIFARQIN